MWMVKSFFVLLVVCAIANCVPVEQADLPRAVSDFASDLYWQVAKSKPGNVIISPLSVATLLALLSQAANGRTYNELQHGLHLKGMDKSTVADQYYRFTQQLQRDIGSAEFTLANQIYVQQGLHLNKNFQNVATNKFRSGVQSLNFHDSVKSAEIINHYVAEKTHGKIKELVKSDSLDKDTDVFLVNAIYFKGKWEHPFNKTHTHKEQFHTYDKQTVLTEFMHLEHTLNFVYSEELKASLVELKYADSKFSFVVVLPNPSTNLEQLASKIKHVNLMDLFNQMRPQGISLSLPKFKVEYKIELNEVLKKLHMGTMFSSMADLSGLLAEDDHKNLYVSKVIHKAFIEVDEEGSESSGSSGAEIKPRTVLRLNANKPFMYYIRDTEANTVIFNGRIETIESK